MKLPGPSPASQRAPGGRRARVAGALRACTLRERLVLVLMLVERLTPLEAARALGLTPRAVDRLCRASLADLRRALRSRGEGRTSRAIARRSVAIEARLRKVS